MGVFEVVIWVGFCYEARGPAAFLVEVEGLVDFVGEGVLPDLVAEFCGEGWEEGEYGCHGLGYPKNVCRIKFWMIWRSLYGEMSDGGEMCHLLLD